MATSSGLRKKRLNRFPVGKYGPKEREMGKYFEGNKNYSRYRCRINEEKEGTMFKT